MDYDKVLRSESAKEIRLPKPVTEDNWKSRMSFCNNLTEAINEYGLNQLPNDFHAQIEPFLNNVLDCAVSERTQLSNAACRLLEKLPEVLERDIHPYLDRILPVLIKLCANTKAVTVKVAAAAVAGIVQYSTYSPRLIYHITQAFEEKPVGPKIHGNTWLQTILNDHHRSIDLHKDGRMICRAISIALEDADPAVRTKSRATYWAYSKIDPTGAEDIMEKLNKQAKTALLNDEHNPDKKSAAAKKELPRPRSALADVRKEQAKKKRAEEEARQKKALNTSTASHTDIEIHEPRKAKKEDKPSKAMSTDRTVEGWQPTKSSMNPPPTHKKVLSTDNEVVSKPSASSQLLKAPVRRPGIKVTPMNNPTPSNRPSSRVGHTAQPKEKEPQKDSRPTSSSSWKSASVGPATSQATSPKHKAVMSPKLQPVTSPNPKLKAYPWKPELDKYVATGQENVPRANILTKNIEKQDNEVAEMKPVVNLVNKIPDVALYEEDLQIEQKMATQRHAFQRPQPPDMTSAEHLMSTTEQYCVAWGNRDNRLYHHRLRNLQDYQGKPLDKLTVRSGDDRRTRNDARDFVLHHLSDFQRDKLGRADPLIIKKLKMYIEQYPKDLIEEEKTFDQLFQGLCYALGSKEDVEGAKSNPNQVYNKSMILQIASTLLKQYHAWSWKYCSFWIEAMIYYRCTLPKDGYDRRVQHVLLSFEHILLEHKEPLEFIDSVTNAIEEGEPILLAAMEKNLANTTELGAEMNSFSTAASWNPYSTRSHIKAIGEIMQLYTGGAYEISKGADANTTWIESLSYYMKKAMNEHNIETIDRQQPYPRTLPVLIDFSLQIYTMILEEAMSRGHTIERQHLNDLLDVAEKCLSSYDYMIKKSSVPFIQVLYRMIIMTNPLVGHNYFLNAFKDESNKNLVEYYISNSKRHLKEIETL